MSTHHHTIAPSSPAEHAAGVPLLELQGITKQFPGVRALDDVSMALYAGEVHMLLGENGAGKSSLIKVLYGAYQADQGQFLFRGKPVQIHSPADAKALGIAVIFQEFSLVPFLNIAQNIYLGREPRGRIPGTIDHARLHKDARVVLTSLGLDYDTHALAGGLGVAQQQMVEIAKALSQNARILVMDEPTSAISDRESEALFAVIRQLREKGVAIVYISHRMKEVFELGDRITVLRDGKRVDSLLANQVLPEALIGMMVGRSVDTVFKRTSFPEPGDVALNIKGLKTATGVRGVDLAVRTGEIVGLSGLVGAGRTEVARAIFGADAITSGEITIFGKQVKGGPDAVSAAGVGLIPENRKAEGLAL
ncbi:MAG TPA: sugar ABC transporter ATP-binding protein, partial [Eoetvoesiella sp.]